MKFEMNEAEKKALEEIKNGKKEFLFNKREHNEIKEEIEAVFFLKTFGFANAELFSDKDKVGHINVTLTDRGEQFFMSEDEIKKGITDKISKLFEEK